MDRIDLLKIFLRIAENGSFSLTAEQLGLPRATVSTAVRQLESKLGTRFFHRTTRKVSLSQDGEILRERAYALVCELEDLEEHFRPSDTLASGRLRINAPTRISRRLLAPALPSLLEKHPQLQIDLGSSDHPVDLIQEGIDCALRIGTLPSSSLVARPLGKLTLINCASPAYLQQYGTPKKIADLNKHWGIDYVASSREASPWEWVENGVNQTLRLNSRVSVDNAETYIACALAGLGLIQVPRFDVLEYLDAGKLVEIIPQARPPAMPINLVYPHRKYLSRRIQVFLDWVQSVLEPNL